MSLQNRPTTPRFNDYKYRACSFLQLSVIIAMSPPSASAPSKTPSSFA
jgi:hypothetical protein